MNLATRGFGAVGAGAERTRQTRFGIWAAVARRNGYSDDVVKLLEEHVDAKFPLHAAAKAGDKTAAKAAAAAGDAKNGGGKKDML